MRIRLSRVAEISAAILVLTIYTPLAHAIQCGDVLGPGGTHELETDLRCELPGPALTLLSGATLEMRNHTIVCIQDVLRRDIGIRLQGERDVVEQGNVENCNIGVDITGMGKHTIRSMNISSGFQASINVLSDGNFIIDNTVRGSDWAFGVLSNKNLLRGNQSINSDGEGFVVGGSNNRLENNRVEFSVCDGFVISGSHNAAMGNEADGNLIAVCGTFRINGEEHRLQGNTARGSASEGFLVSGARHYLAGNTATGNARSGITVSNTSTRNVLFNNNASGNLEFDLRDDNPDCDDNVWRSNEFGTKNVSCIR